jgi:hypothetical protein
VGGQRSAPEVAAALIELLEGPHGTQATAAALQRCFALLLRGHADTEFPDIARAVAHELLESARKRLAHVDAMDVAPRLRQRRDSSASGPSRTPLGPAGGAAQTPEPQLAGSEDDDRAFQRARASHAFWVLTMFAAEQPQFLSGMLRSVLGVAFPVQAPAHGRELVQKFALDIVYHMALDPNTLAEVRFCCLLHAPQLCHHCVLCFGHRSAWQVTCIVSVVVAFARWSALRWTLQESYTGVCMT